MTTYVSGINHRYNVNLCTESFKSFTSVEVNSSYK